MRNLQVIGQAIKDVSEDLKLKNPDVEWKSAARFRDKITHDYFDIDLVKVWEVVEKKAGTFEREG